MSRQGASGLRPALGSPAGVPAGRPSVACAAEAGKCPLTIPALRIVFDASCDAEASLSDGEPARRFLPGRDLKEAGRHGLQAPCHKLAAKGRRDSRWKEQAIRPSRSPRPAGGRAGGRLPVFKRRMVPNDGNYPASFMAIMQHS